MKLYEYLETNYDISKNAEKILSPFSTEGEDGNRVWLEKLILDSYKGCLFDNWRNEVRDDVSCYLKGRLKLTSNIHLQFKYSLALFNLNHDYLKLNSLLQKGIEVMHICVSYNGYSEWEHAFCNLFTVLFPLSKKCKRDADVINIVEEVLNTCSNQFLFNILMMVYWKEQDDAKNENKNQLLRLGKNLGFKRLAELSLELAKSLTDDNMIERCLECAVWFAKRCSNTSLCRDANVKLGDYYFAHLLPDDPKNIAIAAINDFRLKKIMQLYKEVGDHVKLEKAAVVYQENKGKIVFVSFAISVPMEKIEKRMKDIYTYTQSIIKRGSDAILSHLLGYGLNVFVLSRKYLEELCEEYNDSFVALNMSDVMNDGNRNSRNATYKHRNLLMIQDYGFRNFTSIVFQNLIFEGLKNKSLEYDQLEYKLNTMGFDLPIVKVMPDGSKIRTTFWGCVDIGIKDFLEQNNKLMDGDETDWRVCITILGTQFEGLIRNIVLLLGGAIDKINNNYNTERLLLEDLLNSDKLKEVFDNDDIFFFKSVFTNEGFNIRNDVAHSFYMPDEFTANKALLVFLCIMRIAKGTLEIVKRY